MSAAHRAAALAVHHIVGEDDLLIGRLAEGAQGAPQILRWNIEAVDGLLGVCRHRHKATRRDAGREQRRRSEEHTSELQSLMRISYAVFCLKKTHKINTNHIAHAV